MILSGSKMISGIWMHTQIMRETIEFIEVSRQCAMYWLPFVKCFFNRKWLDDNHLFS
jgi:hypothetical protein